MDFKKFGPVSLVVLHILRVWVREYSRRDAKALNDVVAAP